LRVSVEVRLDAVVLLLLVGGEVALLSVGLVVELLELLPQAGALFEPGLDLMHGHGRLLAVGADQQLSLLEATAPARCAPRLVVGFLRVAGPLCVGDGLVLALLGVGRGHLLRAWTARRSKFCDPASVSG
jgi:hypothetical protein